MTITAKLVVDAMCLNHFSRIDRIDVLGYVLADYECFTTEFVRNELRTGLQLHPELSAALEADWLAVEELGTFEALEAFERWTTRIGAGNRDVGEASVFAAAELNHAIAITDDRPATKVAREHGLEVHGTLWLLARSCRSGKLVVGEAATLVEMLADSGMRLPCSGTEFAEWARSNRLLP